MRKYTLIFFSFTTLLIRAQLDQSQKTFYGLLHAHSLICDGSGTPLQAYETAKQSGVDFFALTPHNHSAAESGAKERKDDVLIANKHNLYSGSNAVSVTRKWKENGNTRTETITINPLVKQARESTKNNFVALYGQEFSTISKGNHVNILGIDSVITVEDGNFRAMLFELQKIKQEKNKTIVLQLNHPDVAEDLFYKGNDASIQKNMFNDYGIDEGDLGPHFANLVKELDEYVNLIEVLSGPAMAKEKNPDFRYTPNENDYFFYLKQGFHISPSVGQDNHYPTWGFITEARTGVVAKELTENALYDAFRKHRTFATEDKNLKAIFYVNDSLMGTGVNVAEETELKIKLLIEDADEPTAKYEIQIYGGEINAELSTQATNWKARDGLLSKTEVRGNGTHHVSGIFAQTKPHFYYAKIIQEGKDRTWTAPVWINEPKAIAIITAAPAKYFWTKTASSKVYHLAGCSSISSIKEENLLSGETPPVNRSQHNCNVVEEDGH